MSTVIPEGPAAADAPVRRDSARLVGGWLLLCTALVLAMTMLGGATRLTGSGLSMVEWRPVTGILPPMNAQEWQRVFDLYRASPEYRYMNRGMSLDEFRGIFWLEYLHRLMGRLIGVVFALPLIWFIATGRLPRALRGRMLALLCLGGLQGLLGWYMVQSGLVDEPRVSQYRLAAHLLLAVLIYALLLWSALDVLRGSVRGVHAGRRLRAALSGTVALVVVTIGSGALVAGLKAGFVYNTFPLMAGQWIPAGMWYLQPAWLNLFENIATVQFFHRVLGITTLLVVAALWWRSRGVTADWLARISRHALLGFALLQVSLGIATLVNHVPVTLGTFHQGVALLVLAALLVLRHQAAPARGH